MKVSVFKKIEIIKEFAKEISTIIMH